MIQSGPQIRTRAAAATLALSVFAIADVALADCTPEREAHNKTLIQDFVNGGQNGRDVEAVRQYLSERFVDHSGAQDPTRDGSIVFHEALFSAFPDFQVVIHQQVAECDIVVTHKTFSGTHAGNFFGFHPTNQKVEFDVIDILRIEDDQVVDHWVVNNMVGRLLTQKASEK